MSSATGVRFTVERVAQVDVGNKSPPRIRNNLAIERGQAVPNIFDDYVNEIATMKDKKKVSVGSYTRQVGMQYNLARISNPNLSQSAFKQTAVDIAVRLNNAMGSVSAPTGTLFVAHVRFDGPNIQGGAVDSAVLLKMGPGQIRRLIRDNGQLDNIDENEVYPETSNIKKAAIFPLFNTQTFRRSGDIKLYDQSNSEYFSNFLQCNEVDSSLAQFKRLSKVVSGLLQRDNSGRIKQGDIKQIKSKAEINNNGIIDSRISLRYIDLITSNKITENDIKSELNNADVHEIDTNDTAELKKFKYVVETQNGEISVKLPLSLDEQVSVQQQGSGVLLEIEGNSVTKETTGK